MSAWVQGKKLPDQGIYSKKPRLLYFIKNGLSSLEEQECLMLSGCSCPVPELCSEADSSAWESMGGAVSITKTSNTRYKNSLTWGWRQGSVVRASPALRKDPSSVPSTYMVGQNHA